MKTIGSLHKMRHHWSLYHAATLEASRLGDNELRPQHFLSALVSQGRDSAELLGRFKVTLPRLRQAWLELESADTQFLLGNDAHTSAPARGLRGDAGFHPRHPLNPSPAITKSTLIRQLSDDSLRTLSRLLSGPSTRLAEVLSRLDVSVDELLAAVTAQLSAANYRPRLGVGHSHIVRTQRGQRVRVTEQSFFVPDQAESVRKTLESHSLPRVVLYGRISKDTNDVQQGWELLRENAAETANTSWVMTAQAKSSRTFTHRHDFRTTTVDHGCLVVHSCSMDLPRVPPVPGWYTKAYMDYVPIRLTHHLADLAHNKS